MFRPIQPKFKIRVLNGRVKADTLKSSGVIPSKDGKNYIDIEPCVAYPVEYEEQASLLTTLKFTVDKNADLLLYYFYIGQAIVFYGGYYADDQSTMRHVFSGTVTRIRTMFTDSGKVTFSVECMNYGFTKFGKDFKNFVYPDMNSSRNFAKADSLSLEQIIRGIATENDFAVGEITLSSSARSVSFDKKHISYQKGESDWKFLNRLAQDFGCNVWISTEDGVDKLNFVSHERAFQKQSDIGFLYPLYGKITNALDSEIQKFSDTSFNRPRILRNVTVDEDISAAYAVSRSAIYFNKETGDYEEVVAVSGTDKDGKKVITFYEFDEARVEYVHKNMPEIADEIRRESPTSRPWGTPDNPLCASYYYKVKKIHDEQTAVFDKAFFGITVTATCNQDLNIHSQRTYRIRGILSYHSKDLSTSFFLRGLKHIWDADGTRTELDFIR